MRRSSDSFPIILTLAAFVLMFLGQASYERLADGWMAQRLEPRLGAPAAELVERFFTVGLAGALSLYVVGGLYFFARREFAAPSRPTPDRTRQPAAATRAQRDVWLYDAICRIFLGRWEPIPLQRGQLALDMSTPRFFTTSSPAISGSSPPRARCPSGANGRAIGRSGS
jgi:hypothetical protein